MKLEDLKYICTNLGNLAGIPVRLYEDRNQIFYYSILKLTKDPFMLDIEQAFKLKEDITYYQTPYYYYYGILNYQNIKIVVGPTRQSPISDQELKSIAFSLGIPISLIDEFSLQMKSLVPLPLMSLLQILCMIYFAISGEKRSLENITIHESEQVNIQNETETEGVRRSDNTYGNTDPDTYHNLDIENMIMDMVMRGDVAALNEFVSNAPAVRPGTVAQEQIRQQKNIFIITTTLVARAAIRGGIDPITALNLSDIYMQKCELADTLERITELNYRMVLDYTERVAKIRLGKNPSVLTNKVANYVQQHLSEAIKVEDIAKAIYMGRSRLSTNFKAETGMNISAYITSIKIDEAKRLLRYSDKSFASISMYLGFSSQSHFTQVFKKYTDTTPFEYRQIHKHY